MVLTSLGGSGVLAEPIEVAPANAHYCFYHFKPIILITSAEHSSAVINKNVDYAVYVDALQAHGLNYTRFYPGAMFEPAGEFMVGNTLGTKPGKLIVLWARSDTPGYRLGVNRFDLARGGGGVAGRGGNHRDARFQADGQAGARDAGGGQTFPLDP